MVSNELHEDLRRSQAAASADPRAFGRVFAFVFTLIGLFPLIHGESPRLWLLGVAGLFAAVTATRPALLQPLAALWMRFGGLLHRIVSPLVLAAVFTLLFIPLGLILRMMRKLTIAKRPDPLATSYWSAREPRMADHVKRQF